MQKMREDPLESVYRSRLQGALNEDIKSNLAMFLRYSNPRKNPVRESSLSVVTCRIALPRSSMTSGWLKFFKESNPPRLSSTSPLIKVRTGIRFPSKQNIKNSRCWATGMFCRASHISLACSMTSLKEDFSSEMSSEIFRTDLICSSAAFFSSRNWSINSFKGLDLFS